jgi:hypothetical protein
MMLRGVLEVVVGWEGCGKGLQGGGRAKRGRVVRGHRWWLRI